MAELEAPPGGAPGREETEHERLDRNLTELLGELRVALPGVQVLFAFLLTVPFQQRFETASSFDKNVYFVTLCSTAVASILLIAPSAYHRVMFRLQDKAHIVEIANRFAVVGFLFLGLGMTGAILLVTDFLFSTLTSVIVTTVAAAMFVTFWYLLPGRRRLTLTRRPPG
jgi:predicted neutral ceramidase superfamily lipid hydrolase